MCPPVFKMSALSSTDVRNVMDALDKNFRDNCVKLEAKAKQSMIKSARDRRMKVCAKNADKIDLPTQLLSFSGP